MSHSNQLINSKHLQRVPEPLNGLSVWFSRLHNHGETAHLTVVQKTIIDTLHKEVKPQKVIEKEAGCSQSAVSKHIYRKLSGREKCGRKRCTSSRDDHSLETIVRKRLFKSAGELHKEWTEVGVSASRATTHRRILDMGFKCCDESKFCISFGNQGPRVWRKNGEAHNPRCLKSSVRVPVCVDLGSHVICWCWSTVLY